MIINLHLKNLPHSAIDARWLAPQNFIGLSHEQIESQPIGRNSHDILVRDFFDVSVAENGEIGEIDSPLPSSPIVLILSGDLSSFHRIGQSMNAGCLWVNGSVGSEVAAGMSGGTCVVVGHASDHAAKAFRGGLLAICGHCGNDLASPAPGKKAGMSGGDIFIGGNVGDRVAHRMRRGTILISGRSGNHGCQQMIAGTVVTRGSIGTGWCIGMKRGSLIELSPIEEHHSSHAGFTVGREFELSFLQILWKHLKSQYKHLTTLAQSLEVAFPFRPLVFPQSNWTTRQVGDTLVAGQGEWLRLKSS